MARSKQSPLEDLIDIASKLPWQVGCVLAVVAYVVLHLIAGIVPEKPTGIGQLGNFTVKQMGITLAMFGQFVLPFAFLLGAGISFFKSKKNSKVYTRVEESSDVNALFDMSWQEFEMLVEEYFRRRGYSTTRTGGQGADGGVDIVLKQNSETYLVQCKQWKAYSLGVQPVRELYGVMASMYATGGFVICAGKFTAEAREFAKNINIRLFDGAMLHRMISEVRKTVPQPAADLFVGSTVATPCCPKCGENMVKRVARKGANAGGEFWGCSAYPRCNGVVA